jgi:hypothetical protein
MLQRTVDGQPPRPDRTATGWLQGVQCRLLARRPTEEGFGLCRHASILWLGLPSGYGRQNRCQSTEFTETGQKKSQQSKGAQKPPIQGITWHVA